MSDDQALSETLIKLAESMESLSDALRAEEREGRCREKTAGHDDFEIGTVGNNVTSDIDPLTSYLLS